MNEVGSIQRRKVTSAQLNHSALFPKTPIHEISVLEGFSGHDSHNKTEKVALCNFQRLRNGHQNKAYINFAVTLTLRSDIQVTCTLCLACIHVISICMSFT